MAQHDRSGFVTQGNCIPQQLHSGASTEVSKRCSLNCRGRPHRTRLRQGAKRPVSSECLIDADLCAIESCVGVSNRQQEFLDSRVGGKRIHFFDTRRIDNVLTRLSGPRAACVSEEGPAAMVRQALHPRLRKARHNRGPTNAVRYAQASQRPRSGKARRITAVRMKNET